jgi:F0F1-type ATP synthase assembly protein I
LSQGNKKGLFMGSAFRLGTELVAAVVVGTIIGFILDNWFGTKPWLIIIFFFFRICCWNDKCNTNSKEYAKRELT